MAVCTRCGAQNEEDAAFCKKCGAPIGGAAPPPPEAYPPGDWRRGEGKPRRQGDWDDRCEEDCTGGSGRYAWIWGALIILFGIWIVVEFGVKNIEGLPRWVEDIEFWWVLPVLFGVLFILVGLDMLRRGARYR